MKLLKLLVRVGLAVLVAMAVNAAFPGHELIVATVAGVVFLSGPTVDKPAVVASHPVTSRVKSVALAVEGEFDPRTSPCVASVVVHRQGDRIASWKWSHDQSRYIADDGEDRRIVHADTEDGVATGHAWLVKDGVAVRMQFVSLPAMEQVVTAVREGEDRTAGVPLARENGWSSDAYLHMASLMEEPPSLMDAVGGFDDEVEEAFEPTPATPPPPPAPHVGLARNLQVALSTPPRRAMSDGPIVGEMRVEEDLAQNSMITQVYDGRSWVTVNVQSRYEMDRERAMRAADQLRRAIRESTLISAEQMARSTSQLQSILRMGNPAIARRDGGASRPPATPAPPAEPAAPNVLRPTRRAINVDGENKT